ncbi:MAG TPA: transglycosylase domain-containing protein [Ktedonobacteraceae bacterium]|nr:transglycosylase domain-containing protein [Ktedonobacteraceae bacterium]
MTDANNQTNENAGPPRTGGLLSNYNRQQFKPTGTLSQPLSAPPPAAGPTPPARLPSAPLVQGQPRPRTGLLSSAQAQPQHSGLLSNTLNVVRDWSGKVAAMAGHSVRPPEPPLERYRPSEQNERAVEVYKQQPWRRSRTTRIVRLMRNRRERWHRTQPTAGRFWGILITVVALLIVISSASGSAYGYAYYQNQLPQVQHLASMQVAQTTRIYDRNGTLLFEVYKPEDADGNGGRRTPVSYDDIPQVMQDAMTSTEDHTFWTNAGIDPQGILRAAGTQDGGGSGITQQVVKNLTHNNQPTIDRKLTEAALAIGMTQQYPKWKILEMYFNVAPFGSQTLGIEAAVEDYFHLMPQCDIHFKCVPGIKRLDYGSDKDPHDPLLALARASFLAGMPQKPSSDDPTTGDAARKRALARQADILNLMINFGMSYGAGPITPEVAAKAEALSAKWTFTPYTNVKKAPHFVDWIMDQMKIALGNGDIDAGTEPFITGGFNIRTTIDANLETYVENAVKRHLTQPEQQKFLPYYDVGPLNNPNGHNVNDAAVVVMNSHTGEILAMDGSADYYSNDPRVGGSVNAATYGIGRQPGSTFKPIVYATAFQQGWYPGLVLPDAKTYFPNGQPAGVQIPLTQEQEQDPNAKIYVPGDYGNQYHPNYNPMTIRIATANSFNVPAVKAMQYAGVDNVVNTAERMGLTAVSNKMQNCRKTNPNISVFSCFGVSMVLGTTEVPLLQMTGAYQVFADNGTHVPPQGILDIWDNYGHNLYHFDPNAPHGTQVFSPEVAYMMTSVLVDERSRSFEFPGDHDLSFWDKSSTCAYDYLQCPYQVAAKTGTTSNFIDNWTIGYTPNVVVGVWAGNANGEQMKDVVGITGAAPIWHSVMEYASNGWCNQDVDQVPCTNVNHAALGLGQQNTFTPPAGLRQACVNDYNGLAGSGHCDWVLAGQEPAQVGVPALSVNPPQQK